MRIYIINTFDTDLPLLAFMNVDILNKKGELDTIVVLFINH